MKNIKQDSSDSHIISGYGLLYYIKCFTAGLFPCALTHTLLTPLDLVKCRKQVNPNKYITLNEGLRITWKEEGLKGLYLGWQPTLIGYSLQGSAKFGFYEIFKQFYKGIFGNESITAKCLFASASAEILADLFLCPMESLKIRIQTSRNGSFPTNFISGFNQMKKEGLHGFYKGFVPLILRQVPNTMLKFTIFENTVKFIYKYLFKKEKSQYSKMTKLYISFISGTVAGILCCFISNPADVVVSKLNTSKTSKDIPTIQSIKTIYNEIGFLGLWRGLYIRILIVGVLSGLEWLIYDTFKTILGLETTGSRDSK